MTIFVILCPARRTAAARKLESTFGRYPLRRTTNYPRIHTMAYDLKIFESVNGILSGDTWPNPDFVEGEYSLVQQITKCLLTNPGEDQFDPTYGSGIRADIQGVAGQELERAKHVFSGALQKIVADLKNPQISDPKERLAELRLRSLRYDMISTTWVAEVEVETEAGRSFVISPAVQ